MTCELGAARCSRAAATEPATPDSDGKVKPKTPSSSNLVMGAQVLGRQLSLMQDATQRLCAISATHLETCAERLDQANQRYGAASALAADASGGSEDVRKANAERFAARMRRKRAYLPRNAHPFETDHDF